MFAYLACGSCLLSKTWGGGKRLIILLSIRNLQSIILNYFLFQKLSLCVFFHLCWDLSCSCSIGQENSCPLVCLAECYRCAEAAVVCTAMSLSSASSENSHWVSYGSGQILFWDLFLHSADLYLLNLQEFCAVTLLPPVLNSVQIHQ